MFSFFILAFTLYTLHPTPYTLRPTPYTLYHLLRFPSLVPCLSPSHKRPTMNQRRTKDEPRMKKCLGWHFECCARRVPTLRKSAAHRIKKRTPIQKVLFVKIAVSFFFLIPCLTLPRDDRENTERAPHQLLVNSALFLRLLPNKVVLIPKKVDSFPKNG